MDVKRPRRDWTSKVELHLHFMQLLRQIFLLRGSPCCVSSIFFTGVFDTFSSSTKFSQQHAVIGRFLKKFICKKKVSSLVSRPSLWPFLASVCQHQHQSVLKSILTAFILPLLLPTPFPFCMLSTICKKGSIKIIQQQQQQHQHLIGASASASTTASVHQHQQQQQH